jgi:hypothetical protein
MILNNRSYTCFTGQRKGAILLEEEVLMLFQITPNLCAPRPDQIACIHGETTITPPGKEPVSVYQVEYRDERFSYLKTSACIVRPHA